MKSISFMLILKNNCFKIKVLREFNSAHKKCENIFFVLNRQAKKPVNICITTVYGLFAIRIFSVKSRKNQHDFGCFDTPRCVKWCVKISSFFSGEKSTKKQFSPGFVQNFHSRLLFYPFPGLRL